MFEPVTDADGLPRPLSGIRALRWQRQQEPPVLPEPLAPNLNPERLSGAAQRDLRDPERGGFPKNFSRRTLPTREGSTEELDGLALSHPLLGTHRLDEEPVCRVGGLARPRDTITCSSSAHPASASKVRRCGAPDRDMGC